MRVWAKRGKKARAFAGARLGYNLSRVDRRGPVNGLLVCCLLLGNCAPTGCICSGTAPAIQIARADIVQWLGAVGALFWRDQGEVLHFVVLVPICPRRAGHGPRWSWGAGARMHTTLWLGASANVGYTSSFWRLAKTYGARGWSHSACSCGFIISSVIVVLGRRNPTPKMERTERSGTPPKWRRPAGRAGKSRIAAERWGPRRGGLTDRRVQDRAARSEVRSPDIVASGAARHDATREDHTHG